MASAGTDRVRPGFTKRLDCITTMQFDIIGPESAASPIGLINLEMKLTGKPGAGNPHAGFDEAGTGNGDTDNSKRARRGKTWIQPRDCPDGLPRQFSTLPM